MSYNALILQNTISAPILFLKLKERWNFTFEKLANKVQEIFNGSGEVSMTLNELKNSQMTKFSKMKLSSNSSSLTLSMKKLWTTLPSILLMVTTASQSTNIPTILTNGDYVKSWARNFVPSSRLRNKLLKNSLLVLRTLAKKV
jgi:hypothetical protein